MQILRNVTIYVVFKVRVDTRVTNENINKKYFIQTRPSGFLLFVIFFYIFYGNR